MIFNSKQRKKLENFYERKEGGSLIESLFLNDVWLRIVDYLPLWLSANLITIVGLVVNILTTLIIVYYSPDCRQQVPAWAMILSGLGLLFYGTCDGLDGKQGLRTDSHDIISEFIDHTSDTVSALCVSIRACVALTLGVDPWCCVLMGIGANVAFFFTNLEAFITDVLRLPRIEVTESQWTIIGFCFIHGIYGADLFTMTITSLGLRLNVIMLAAMCVAFFLTYIRTFRLIGNEKETVANSSPPAALLPMCFVLGSMVIAFAGNTSGVYTNNICLFISVMGLAMAKRCCWLTVGRAIATAPPFLDTVYIGTLAMLFNQHVFNFMDEYWLMVVFLAYNTFDIFYFIYVIERQACEAVNRPFFTTTVRDKPFRSLRLDSQRSGANGHSD